MEKISLTRIALKWGLIQGIISIVFTTILYNTDLWKNWMVSLLLSLVLTFIILYFALNEFKQLNAGFLTFGEGVSIGTLTMATGGFLSVIYDFSYKKYIDPNIINLTLENAREQYESMGFSEEQIEMSIEKAEQYMTSGVAFILAMVFIVLLGLLCSVIMSAILKKEKSIFD